MKYLDNEQTLWESKNKQLLLTTHRLREVDKSFFGSAIKSIMLEELTSCELRTTRQYSFLRRAVLYFLLINGSVFLLNHYLFKAEIVKFLFGEVYLGPDTAGLIFYLSLAIALTYLLLFAFSFKKTFSFYAIGMTIDFQLRWLDFDERESFISKVEAAKDQRHRQPYVQDKKEIKMPAHNKG
jgi:hypothetical protein